MQGPGLRNVINGRDRGECLVALRTLLPRDLVEMHEKAKVRRTLVLARHDQKQEQRKRSFWFGRQWEWNKHRTIVGSIPA